MRQSPRGDRGYAMAVLLVGIAVMGILLSAAMPVWRTVTKREREEELVFRGQQYARAIVLFQRKYANAYPASVDFLVKERFLRRKYRDPMTKDGEFQVLYEKTKRPGAEGQPREGERAGETSGPRGLGSSSLDRPGLSQEESAGARPSTSLGQQTVGPLGGVVGVASRSTDKSLRVYNGQSIYKNWEFVWQPAKLAPTEGPDGQPGSPGRGQPGVPRGASQPGQLDRTPPSAAPPR